MSFSTILIFLAIVVLEACSSEKNTWTSKAFHNTTAHYNGYYYAREEIQKIEKTIWSSLTDDYSKILTHFIQVDSTLQRVMTKKSRRRSRWLLLPFSAIQTANG